MSDHKQLSLFDVAEAYADHDSLDNSALYATVADRIGIPPSERNARAPVGKAGTRRNLYERKVRWYQQTLKGMGLLERVEGRRGIWRLTREGRAKVALHRIERGTILLAFSTDLGVALIGDCRDVFARLDAPITLCVTSPPYPLREARAYGNPPESQFVDWLCEALEPVVSALQPGGSIVLNLSNDIFDPGSPARSLYRERLVLALHDRLGLHKMDEIPWVNRSKPPGPVQWASLRRYQLNVAWEPIYWLTNDPQRVRSDNRRVLRAHSKRHQRLIEQGGTQRNARYGDGAYVLRPGAYGTATTGTIPKNVFERGHRCASNREYAERATAIGLPVHRAVFPLSLPEFFVRFLSEPGDLVVDPFAGSGTTALAAERLQRRWLITDVVREYLQGAAERFKDCAGWSVRATTGPNIGEQLPERGLNHAGLDI